MSAKTADSAISRTACVMLPVRAKGQMPASPGLEQSLGFNRNQLNNMKLFVWLGLTGLVLATAGYAIWSGAVRWPDDFRVRPAPTTTPGPEAIPEPELTPDYLQLRTLVQSLPADQQRRVLTQKEHFMQLLSDELAARSLVAMARAAGAHKIPATARLVQRQTQQLLRQRFREQYLKQQLPEDYPDATQLQEYYDRDPSRFSIPQRVQLWQIFFPVSSSAQEPQVRLQAQQLLTRIRAGELSFAEAASAYSGHLPSRYRGGHAGLLDLPDIDRALLPALLELETGVPGGPLRGTEGYHILMRGELQPEIALDFAHAKPLVRQRMRELRGEQLYRELTQQAVQDYPYQLAGDRVRQWWLDMRVEAGLADRTLRPGEGVEEQQ